MFKDLLFQVVVVLFPVLLYYSLFKPNGYQLKKTEKKLMVGIFSCFSILVVMSFPVSFDNGTILDLRSVPWIISFFYGGHIVGIVVTVLLIVYRFFLSFSTGALITFVTYTTVAALIFLLYKDKLHQLKNRLRPILTMGFITTLLLVIKIHIFVFDSETNTETMTFLVFFIISNLFALYLVTTIIEALEDRNNLYQQMQLREKQYIVGQLAASVAHEIRNPMTVISGFVQLIDQSKDTSEEHRRYASLMMLELARAEAIIKDYLSLAKQEAGKMEKVDVNLELLRVKETLQSYALLNGVEIFVYCQDETAYIYGDKHKYTQVLVNIIKNAIEASEGSGEVSVFCSTDHETVVIEIKDYGKGMTENQLKNLGIPFYSMKDKGTGLGLMVCYNIIEAMKGKIEVESEVNIGTSFKITIPTFIDHR